MKTYVLMIAVVFLVSCQDLFLGNDPPDTPRENFETLWNTLDKKYSYFSYKNIDWDEVYSRYSPKVNDTMSDVSLFNLLFDMLSELKDSHVNLIAPFNTSRYDKLFQDSPENFENRILSNYLGKDYWITGPLIHQVVGKDLNIGYIRYPSFTSSVSGEHIDVVINKYKDMKGLIIDVRNNGGGQISNMFNLISRFADKERHVYTSVVKNGPGHEDFSRPNEVIISPAGTTFAKPVCILTNRGSYSATSFFVLAMREFPNVTVVGDTTGGGLGAPTGAELPNGWAYRFSASRTLSVDGINYEDGIPPDVLIYLNNNDVRKGIDTIIQKAISIIIESYN